MAHAGGTPFMATNQTEKPTHTSMFIKSDTDEAVFLGNPVLDNMMDAFIALGAEVWAGRRRMMVIERLLEEKGISGEMIEAYLPEESEEAAWGAERDAFIHRIFDVLKRPGGKDLATQWAPGQGPRSKEV
jgi:hypothetical protein